MPQYEIIGGPKDLRVWGDQWLAALGEALSVLGMDSAAMGRLVIEVGRTGDIDVRDPVGGKSFRLVPVEDLFGFSPVTLSAMQPPRDSAPARSAGHASPGPGPRPDDLPDRIGRLALSFVRAESGEQASLAALAALNTLVGAESGAVLLSDASEDNLVFCAAFGPVADKLVGTAITRDTGVAGFSFQLGIGVIVNHAARDVRHDKTVDQRFGYTTANVLAVPLAVPGMTGGCLELVNAPGGFKDWHLEAALSIAARLAEVLKRLS